MSIMVDNKEIMFIHKLCYIDMFIDTLCYIVIFVDEEEPFNT